MLLASEITQGAMIVHADGVEGKHDVASQPLRMYHIKGATENTVKAIEGMLYSSYKV